VLFGRAKNDEWQKIVRLAAHESSVNSVSWDKHEKRFATAGSDKSVKVWAEDGGQFVEVAQLERHKELVRDV
jgi:WD40 repeat protein